MNLIPSVVEKNSDGERVYDIWPIALRSKYGVFMSDSPTTIAVRSSSDNTSLIIILILPPLYRKAAKPSANTLIAEEEKKPSLMSNVVALHNASEKKPNGSQSVRDMKRRLLGHMTSVFSI